MATVILEHSRLTGSGRLGRVLRDHGHRLRVLRLYQGDPAPDDLDGVDAVVSCGGPQAPIDDGLEWMGAELEFLRRAHDAALPVFGICLGSQLLARALGGEIEAIADGMAAGWSEISLTAAGREDPLYAGIAWRSMQVVWHRFHVSKPPPGARVLARSERTPAQAWALGIRTYAVQYHPEVEPETIEAWADDQPDAVKAAGLTREQLRRQTEENYQAYARLADRLFESVALLLMPVDRRYAGIAKDLHH